MVRVRYFFGVVMVSGFRKIVAAVAGFMDMETEESAGLVVFCVRKIEDFRLDQCGAVRETVELDKTVYFWIGFAAEDFRDCLRPAPF